MIPTIEWRGGLRLLLLALLITWLQPAPLLIEPGPPREVSTTHPILGVHTRLADEVEPWKIQRTLQLVREMGATSIVEFFPWAYYHGEDGSFAWDHPDLVVDHAVAQGLTIYARLGLTPGWARPEGEEGVNYLDREHFDDFAAYAAAFAERYRGKVDYLIVWNEPNLLFEWGWREATPEDYALLLKTIYPAVRAVNPEIEILGGALAPTLEPAGSPNGVNDLLYLQALYDAGAAPYFDGLAAHTYGLTSPPEAEPGPERLNFRRIELLREIMVANGDAEKQIHITESGWNDHPRWTMAVRPGQRIAYTRDAILWAENHWPYVDLVALWVFRTSAPVGSYMDYFALVTPEFIKRPIYDELQIFTGNAPPAEENR